MLALLRNKRGQNIAEYAIMLALVIGVFSAMQLYVRRGLQARVKAGVDNIPGAVTTSNIFGTATQYEPLSAANMTTLSSEGTEKGTISEAGGLRTLENATTSRTGYQTINLE